MLILLVKILLNISLAGLQIPSLTSPVMDEAGVISNKHFQVLEKLIRAANSREKVQLTVLTLPTLEDEPIEQASIRIVEQWKLGKAKKDNGVLFLVAVKDKKARIEVGQGLEGDLPDIAAKRILADGTRPYFKKGLYSEGILFGVIEILKKADPEFSLDDYVNQKQFSKSQAKEIPNGLLVLGLFFIIFGVIPQLNKAKGGGRGFNSRQGGWYGGTGGGGWGGGGSGSGGGWSGGGGGFSGGGSSGSW